MILAAPPKPLILPPLVPPALVPPPRPARTLAKRPSVLQQLFSPLLGLPQFFVPPPPAVHPWCCCGGCPTASTLQVTFSNVDTITCTGCYGGWHDFKSASGFDGSHTVSKLVDCVYTGSPTGTLEVDVYSGAACTSFTATDTYNNFSLEVDFYASPADGSIIRVLLADTSFSIDWVIPSGTKFLGDTIDATYINNSCGSAWNDTNASVVVSL